MGIPLAVAPSVRSPGLALLVNLLAGPSSPGTADYKVCLVASKSSSGTITADTQLKTAVAGPDEVKTLLGPGTPGHLASKAAFAEHGLLQMDVIAPAESAGVAATGTFTFAAGPPTVARTVTFDIHGRQIVMTWAAGETDTQGAAKAVLAINAESDDLAVVASNVAGVVTVTFKLKGPLGNDCLISVTVADGSGGTVTASGAALTGGTTEASIATALTTIAGKEYDLIILAANGNADTNAASATSAPGRVKTHIEGLDQGFNAKLQQAVVGSTGTLSAVKTGTGQQNSGILEFIFVNAARGLPAEWAGAEAGARAREEDADPAANRINMEYQATLYPPADLEANALTEAQVEDALQTGVTAVTYTADGSPRPSRPITSYHKDTGGNPDDRLLDTSRVTGTYAVAKDLRVALPQQYPGAKLSKDLVAGDDPPPDGVVQEKHIKLFVIDRVRFWVSEGVVNGVAFDEALETGTFICQVDTTDPSQLDIVLPLSIVPPLAKFSVVVNHIGPQ